ncbi:MAG: hypothetical protein AAGA68_22450 [Pseudomonadota bacterium]
MSEPIEDRVYTRRVQALADALQPYCPGGSKRFALNDDFRLALTLTPPDLDHREEIERVLHSFQDIVGTYRVQERLPSETPREHLASCDFAKIQRLIAEDLQSIAALARDAQGTDAAYALVVWMDPDQGALRYRVCCGEAFAVALETEQRGASAKYYEAPADIERFRYFDYETFSYDPSRALSSLLNANSERSYALYRRYGEPYLSAKDTEHFELMTQACADAIHEASASVRETLLTDDNFAIMISFYDQSEMTEYRGVRRTVGTAQLRTIMGHCYGDLLG